jgi:hypothetical protein
MEYENRVNEDEIIKAWIVMIYNDLHNSKDKNKKIFPDFPQFIKKISREKQEYLWILFCLLAETRDIYNGKGEIDASFQYIEKWLEYDYIKTINALFWMCKTGIASWKDLNYISHQISNSQENKHIIEKIVRKINEQLYKDLCELDISYHSQISKSIPKEGSNYGGWFYDELAKDWCIITNQDYLLQNKKDINKCRRRYRQTISKLNKEYKPFEKTLKKQSLQKTIQAMKNTNHYQENQTLEEEFNQNTQPLYCNKIKNILPIWIPSKNQDNFDKQVATLLQTMKKSNKKRIFIMDPIPRIITWEDNKSWIEITKDLYSYYREGVEESNLEELLILFQDLVVKMRNISSRAKEKMTWIWICDFNINQQLHTSQMIPFWKNFIETNRPTIETNEPTIQTNNPKIQTNNPKIQTNKESKPQKASLERQNCIISEEEYSLFHHQQETKQTKDMPHMVFCITSDRYYANQQENTRTLPCNINTKRCTMVPATKNGISQNQWNQIEYITKDQIRRNYSCWENIQSVAINYLGMIHESL